MSRRPLRFTAAELAAAIERIRAATATTEDAYLAGHDCALNGPNESNCHFFLFRTPELTTAWERGKADGDAERCAAAHRPAKPPRESDA